MPEAFVDVEQGECAGGDGGKGWKGKGVMGKSVLGMGKGKRKRKKRVRGVELDRIPLCVDCGSEMDGKDEGRILERGLETVERFDGGLSRSRLLRISEATDREREVDGFSMRWVEPLVGKGEEVKKRESKMSKLGKRRSASKFEDEMPLVKASASWESVNEDSLASSPMLTKREGNDFLASKLDSKFEPNRPKPLPKWMSLLPSSREKKATKCPEGRHSHSLESHSEIIEDEILEFPIATLESDTDIERGQTPIAERLYFSAVQGPKSYLTPRFETNIDEIIVPKPFPTQLKSLERRPDPTAPRTGKSLEEMTLPPSPAPEQIESLTKRPKATFPILRNKALSLSASATKRKNPFVRVGGTGNPMQVVRAASESSVYYTPLEEPPPAYSHSSPKEPNRPEPKTLTSYPCNLNTKPPSTPVRKSSLPRSPLSSNLKTHAVHDSQVEQGGSGRRPGMSSSLRSSGGGHVSFGDGEKSAEFLEKYKPLSPKGSGRARYEVGEVGSIIRRFERKRVSVIEKEKAKEKEKEDGKGEGEGKKGDGVRDGLRRELKSLFEKS